MGVSVPLIGRLAIPEERLLVVLRYATAIGIHEAEVELGSGQSLVGQLTPDSERIRTLFAGGLLALTLFATAMAGQLVDGWLAYQRGDYAEAAVVHGDGRIDQVAAAAPESGPRRLR